MTQERTPDLLAHFGSVWKLISPGSRSDTVPEQMKNVTGKSSSLYLSRLNLIDSYRNDHRIQTGENLLIRVYFSRTPRWV